MNAPAWPPPPVGGPATVVLPAEAGQDPPMIVKTYRGSTQARAAGAMAADGPILAAHGYMIAAQSWAAGGRTAAAALFVVLGVLCLIGGLLFFPLWGVAVVCLVIGLVSGKGEGELTVTWAKR